MTKAIEIVTAALRKLTVLDATETPSAEDGALGLEYLNDMLESWAHDEYLIYDVQQVNRPLTSGVTSFTIGPTGDVVGERPIDVLSGYVRRDTSDAPLVIYNRHQYNALREKTTPDDVPEGVFYEASLPDGRVFLVPPVGANCTVFLDVQRVVARFATLQTDVSLPPAYKRALQLNLAIELAPDYSKQVSPELQRLAFGAKSQIKGVNFTMAPVDSEAALLGAPFSPYYGER